MTAAVEEADTDTISIPDWAIGYSLVLPCDKRSPKCENEADWFASQHDCIRANLCEDHMLSCYRDVVGRLREWGSVRCTVCRQDFYTFETFIRCVRI